MDGTRRRSCLELFRAGSEYHRIIMGNVMRSCVVRAALSGRQRVARLGVGEASPVPVWTFAPCCLVLPWCGIRLLTRRGGFACKYKP